ncbi:MAG: hypothetical protein ACOH2H_21755 [Cypionkella sp.]
MKRFFLSTALACMIVTTPAFATSMISTVDVSIDLPAVTNKAAALRFSHIADDLKAAIAVLLVDRLDPEGATITIDLSEVELSDSYTEDAGIADTRLVGIVNVNDPVNNKDFDNYTLTVDVNKAKMYLPADADVTVLKAGSDVYYKAMIDAFATAVVEKLPK